MSDLVTMVAGIQDRQSLQLVSRVVEAQVTLLEAQAAQLKQIQAALKERQGGMK